tara:strand:- start:1756 stop:3483 length:1728 start_codon:yes stop_codon:yes gene_type:complete
MRINIININEKSIFDILFNWNRKNNYYIGINPYLIILKPILLIIIMFLEKINRIHKIEELHDNLNNVGGDKRSLEENQSYNSIKSYLTSKYELDTNKMQYGDYSYAYYHLTDLYLFSIVQDIENFEVISRSNNISNFIGFNFEYKNISKQLKSSLSSKFVTYNSKNFFPLKIINTIAILFRSIIYIFSKTKLFHIDRQEASLAVDMVIGQKEDDPQIYIIKKIMDDENDALLVFRNKFELESAKNQFNNYTKCIIEDGRISLYKLPKLFYMIFKDAYLLFNKAKKYNIRHFNLIINLLYQRVRLFIFFEKYNAKCYWGRDDYNTIHTLRTLELRSRGNLSIGIQHGLIIINPRPSKTYLDFDLYYVFGEKIKKFYLDTWSKKMEVKAIGCWGAGQDYFYLNESKNRPKNIIYYQNMTYLDDIIMDEILKIAKHFKNRKMIIKPKYHGLRKKLFDNFIKKYNDLPMNIEIHYGNSYKVMSEASYAITLFSTIGAESLQFDLVPFWIDIDKDIKPHYFREFPELCFNSSDEIINRIDSIEDGSYKFNKDDYVDLINFKEKNIFDLVKNDINNFIINS